MIATEKGWNLYVGGNGGATPAHARLLAGDLDTETLVRYLDRFLMYYIRTADRLQRTAPWVDSLEGGLDRVREVVVDDALGLGSRAGGGDGPARRRPTSTSGGPRWRTRRSWRRFVSFVNAPGHAGPAHHLPRRARPDGAGRRRPGRCCSARPSRSGPRDRVIGRPTSRSAASTTSRSRAASRRWSTARRSQSSGHTTATSSRCPTTTLVAQASVLARGIVGTRGGHPLRRLTDAQAGLRPAHRTVPRRRGGPGPDVRRAGRPTVIVARRSAP